MDTGKIKNIIILVLLMLNAALGTLLVTDKLAQSRFYREAEENFFLSLEQRGLVAGETLNLPEEMPRAWSLERDIQAEERMAVAFLGTVRGEDQGGNAYYYEGRGGVASFRGTGEFEFVLDSGERGSGSRDVVLQALRKLGLEADAADFVVQPGTEGDIVDVICRWQGSPVWNCRVRFFFRGEILWRISGQRMFDTATVEPGDCFSATQAVLRFLESDGAAAAAVLESVTQGYTMSVLSSGSCRLQPVWLLETDAGRFQVNAVTGLTEQLAE